MAAIPPSKTDGTTAHWKTLPKADSPMLSNLLKETEKPKPRKPLTRFPSDQFELTFHDELNKNEIKTLKKLVVDTKMRSVSNKHRLIFFSVYY